MRKTKVICTVGPASRDSVTIRNLVRVGVDIFRINFSFGDAKSHSDEILNLRREAHRSRRELGILQDLPGPKIRIGKMLGGSADISKGHSFILTSKPILGNSHRASINNTQLISFLKPGDIVFIADGIIELRVDKVRDGQANCIVLVGGRLGSGKGVNVPGAKLKIRYPTPEDLGHLEAGKALGVDFIALSFIRTAKDIRSVRDWAKQKSSSLFIIAKIEKREAVANFDSILKESDGVMIARGDLGIEVPIERVPMIQKEIIRKCNASGKPVIVATQMLESMVFSPVPTRAEATDVSTAILDGADALLLSDETAIGRYPIEAIRVLDKIAAVTEPHLPPLHHSTDELRPLSVEEAVGHAAAQLADDIQASAIVAPTQTGLTAIRVARYRPRAPVIAICVDRDIARRLSLYRGTYPIVGHRILTTDEMLTQSEYVATRLGLAKRGDKIVVTSGTQGLKGSTDFVKVRIVPGKASRDSG